MKEKFIHPYDTVLSSGLRFLSELIAWVAGTMAVAKHSIWLAILFLIFLVALPSIFSTVNDKNNVVIPIAGSKRVVLEMFLFLVASISPWFIWSSSLSVICCIIVIASIVTGGSRFIWLIRGAPLTD